MHCKTRVHPYHICVHDEITGEDVLASPTSVPPFWLTPPNSMEGETNSKNEYDGTHRGLQDKVVLRALVNRGDADDYLHRYYCN